MKVSKPAIVVVGSSNMDLVVKTPRIPAAGETILGDELFPPERSRPKNNNLRTD